MYKQYCKDSFIQSNDDDMDFDFEQVPDDKIITIIFDPYGSTDIVKATAKEWTKIKGKGFLSTTEY
jgi:hypothetical protein